MSTLLEPPEGRQVFTRDFEPRLSDIDDNGHVNNVVYLDWAQQLAIAHWRARAPDDAQAQWAWIALRHEIDYRRALLPGETAHGRTWVSATAEGPRFDRYVRLDADDGAQGPTMCAQCVTTWVLVEQATGRPRRVPAWMVEMFA